MISTAAAGAALLSVGVAGAAEAPVVSSQTTWQRSTSPVTGPGTGLKQGATIPKGARLVYRDVTVSPGQKARLELHATGGRTLKGLAPGPSHNVGFVVVKPYSYPGKTKVTLRAWVADKSGGRVRGRIYAYTR